MERIVIQKIMLQILTYTMNSISSNSNNYQNCFRDLPQVARFPDTKKSFPPVHARNDTKAFCFAVLSPSEFEIKGRLSIFRK